MKLLLLADLHFSDRPPSSCTETYTDDLFDLLGQAVRVGTERGAEAMVWAGDTFDKKAPSRTSHRLVHRLCDFIDRETPFPTLILAGNHDITNDRTETAWDSQPLGTLFRAGAFDLNGWAGSALPVYGVPWLQGYGNYREQGDDLEPGAPLLPIEYRVGDALAHYREKVYGHGTGTEKPLVVTHAPLYPPGKELPYEYFPTERWAEPMSGQGAVFYGHVHEPHGVYQAGGVTFCNNGALSRGSLHEYNLSRQVGVTLYDTQIGEFEFVPLDAKPPEQVFRLKEKQQVTDAAGRLDEFLAGAGAASLEVLSVESVNEYVRSLGLGRDVEELVAELLEEAGHGKGK